MGVRHCQMLILFIDDDALAVHSITSGGSSGSAAWATSRHTSSCRLLLISTLDATYSKNRITHFQRLTRLLLKLRNADGRIRQLNAAQIKVGVQALLKSPFAIVLLK